jgi:hypothetical protein
MKLAMKLAPVSLATLAATACLLSVSCNSADPSAISEGQKALAEAMAKNIRLEEEIAGLRTELEEARTKTTQVEAVKMPTISEIESKLDLEGAKLKDDARQQFPKAKVESFGTWDLNIPSFDRPFSCKAKVVIKESSGSHRTLYWTGSANMKGEWIFETAENLEPKKAEPAVVQVAPPPVESPPVESPAVAPVAPKPPPVREKPKPRYDIQLDNPVMGPGAR